MNELRSDKLGEIRNLLTWIYQLRNNLSNDLTQLHQELERAWTAGEVPLLCEEILPLLNVQQEEYEQFIALFIEKCRQYISAFKEAPITFNLNHSLWSNDKKEDEEALESYLMQVENDETFIDEMTKKYG